MAQEIEIWSLHSLARNFTISPLLHYPVKQALLSQDGCVGAQMCQQALIGLTSFSRGRWVGTHHLGLHFSSAHRPWWASLEVSPVHSPVPGWSWHVGWASHSDLGPDLSPRICLMITRLSMGPNSITNPVLLTLLVRWLAGTLVTLSSHLTFPSWSSLTLTAPWQVVEEEKKASPRPSETQVEAHLIFLEHRPRFNH